MSEVKISVIMPVYNVEQYVGKAVESVLAQSFTEWELLIVDDGSKDGSGEICDGYARRDGRIRVIHKENGGAHSARNAAIELARGVYAYFMDADDWATAGMLDDMYRTAEANRADLVVFGYYLVTYCGNRYLTEKICVDDRVYEDARSFREESYRYFDRNMLYTPWNKLYRMEIIRQNGLRFPDTLWDDFPFNMDYMRHVERVAVSTAAYYHFIRERADSETSAYCAGLYEKREEEHGWLLELYREWGVDNAGTREMLSRRYIERMVGCIANVTSSQCELNGRQRREAIRTMLGNPRVDRALTYARPRSFYMKLLLLPIRWKSTWLTWLESAVITCVKERNTKLFAKLKAGRSRWRCWRPMD